VRESLCQGHADTFGERTRNLFPGERERFSQRSVNFKNTCLIGSYSQSIPGERCFCDTLPSKQAVARWHPEDWLLAFAFGGRSGPGVPRSPSRRLPRGFPPFGRVPPRSELATSCWKAHGWLVQTAHEEEGSRVTRCAHTSCSGDGNPPRFCLSAGEVPGPTHDRSCLPPSPVPCPGASRCWTAQLG